VKSPFLISQVGKSVSKISRLKGGHGSALPGLVVEKVSPHFLRDILGKLPRGVVVISGTNGKTTTTKMVVELLRASGLKVFTNPSGSNFTRGVVSSAVTQMKRGKLDADIAVLELDEAHAVHFVREIPPKYCLLLNVLHDQTDRFGSIETAAKLLETVAKKTTTGVVLNRDNSQVSKIAKALNKQKVSYFGHTNNLKKKFPDEEKVRVTKKTSVKNQSVDVELTRFSGPNATYLIDGKNYDAKLQMNGSHNILNGAAALTMARMILGEEANNVKLIRALGKVPPAFGRGETIEIDGQPLELILVKNPSGFRFGLTSQFKKSAATMIAINNTFADGRDISWLGEVDYRALKNVVVASGTCADDMAKVLKKDNVTVDSIEPDLRLALNKFLNNEKGRPKQIFCNYSAMLFLREMLVKGMKRS